MKVALGLGALALVGGIAIASSHVDSPATRAEAAAKARGHFTRMDANKDGRLDAADRGAHHQQMAAAMFDRVDADRNGSISRDEWNAGAAQLARAHAEGGMPRHMLRMQRPAMHMNMMRADTDGDRAITAEEFEARALARFDRADTNKDGILSAAEREARPRHKGHK